MPLMSLFPVAVHARVILRGPTYVGQVFAGSAGLALLSARPRDRRGRFLESVLARGVNELADRRELVLAS